MDNLHRYLQLMSLVKLRLNVINNIVSGKYTTGYSYSDIEICVLEIRKIIELIAMGSLVSNIDAYSKIHDKYQCEWNARYMFSDIERINPRFYPEPIDINKNGEIDEFVPIKLEYLTKADALKVYEKCGGFLHEDNPFGSPRDENYYKNNIPIWNTKIINLLNRHLIHIHQDSMYFIVMSSNVDGNPAGNVFEAIKID